MSELILPPDVVRLSASASDAEILAVVESWVAFLVAEDYERAYGMTAHEPYYQWTAKLIREVIEGYGLPDPHPEGPFKVTPLATAKGGPTPWHKVERDDPPRCNGAIANVWFDLPLNGEWSDLTATFSIHPLDEGIVLSLNEIHVF